jgi:hypothetical protein
MPKKDKKRIIFYSSKILWQQKKFEILGKEEESRQI